jgi:CheY-like chemotaxis protein
MIYGPGMDINNNQQPLVIEPCQVLLIDDSADDLLLARREIEKSDFVKEVVTFGDGQKLIKYMHEQGFMDHSVFVLTPVMIVVDLEMPTKNGLEIIKELKSDNFLKAIPLIVVTGTKSTDKIQQARDLGANGVFRKPIRKEVLNRFFSDAWKWPPEDIWIC